MFASRGVTWLLWFLANISANLAVVNFLPLPIVDGGLFTLLILEKIQGKPLSPDAQRIVQMVGLVLILGVFLMVTYQDIARLAGY
jgi:regulator of sigma E protease